MASWAITTLLFSFLVLVSCSSFHEACEQGDINLVSNILGDETFDVNEFDSNGMTALGSVASNKYYHQSSFQIANLLLKHPNIDYEKGSLHYESPLFLAITHGNYRFANRLLEIPDLRVNAKAPGHSFCTPLLAAIKSAGKLERKTGALKMIVNLLNHTKININVSCKKLIPFLEAIKYADEATVMLLLNRHISDPRAVDENGKGIFHLLARMDPIPFRVLDHLRSMGTFDINMTDRDGNTFAHLMASRVTNPGSLPIVLKSLEIKRISQNIVNEKGELPLHIILKTMLAEEKVNQKLLHSIFAALDDRSDFTALQAEDENGDTVVHLLVKLLVSGYSFDRLAFNFIHDAVKYKNFDLDAQNKKGQTVLHLLLGSNANPLLVEQLLSSSILKFKVNPNITDVDGHTAPQLALKNGNAQYLLSVFAAATHEEFILHMMRNPISNFPYEPIDHMLDKDGFLVKAIEKKWHRVAEILMRNPRFGYTLKLISTSTIFLEKAIDSFNHDMCIRIWPLYRDNIDFSKDAEFLQILLESGIQYIFEDLESKGISIGGKDGNSKDHWAAFHGWTTYLSNNLEHIKVNSSNDKGMTLLNLALSGTSSLMQIKETVQLLFKKPAKIDLFELYNGNRLSVDQFPYEVIETFIESAFDHFLEQNDPNRRSLILSNFERLRLMRFKKTKVDLTNKTLQTRLADFEYLLGNLSTERKDAFYKKIIKPVSGSIDFNEISIASRSALIQSAMEEIDRLEREGINLAEKRVYIKFVGEKGGDAGALGREFFYDVMQEIFQNYPGLFEEIGEYDTFVNVKDFDQAKVTEDMIEVYKFVGKILGLSVLNECNLPKRFSHLLLRQLMGLAPTWRDSEPIDKTVFKSAEGNINLSEDDFNRLNVTYMDIGVKMLSTELDEGEELDDENPVKYKYREQVYTRCTIARFLNDRTMQVAAIKEGLNSIISDENLSALFPADLHELMTGSDDIDLQDWMDNTKYAGIYQKYKDDHGEDHPTIKFFWNFLAEHPEEKLRVFTYSTGYRLVPSGGMGKLKEGRKYMIESLQRYASDAVDANGNLINDTYYPDTASCYFILKLPPYSTQEILTERMKFALDKYSGFQNN